VRPPFDAKSTVECVPPGLHPAAEEWLQLPRAPATGSGCAIRRRGRPTSNDDVAGVSVWRVCRVLKFSQTPARMSRPIVSSPTLRFNRFIFFSRSVFVFLLPGTKCTLRPEQEAIALLLHLGYFQPVPPRRFSCLRLTHQQTDYQRCSTLGNAELLPAVARLTSTTSLASRSCTIGGSISKGSRISCCYSCAHFVQSAIN
jgi:hypothetical protein